MRAKSTEDAVLVLMTKEEAAGLVQGLYDLQFIAWPTKPEEINPQVDALYAGLKELT